MQFSPTTFRFIGLCSYLISFDCPISLLYLVLFAILSYLLAFFRLLFLLLLFFTSFRVVVRYTFLVQDWLSEVRGDGRTLRHIPALDTSSTDSGTMFDVISKKKLYDDHLWLSVAR